MGQFVFDQSYTGWWSGCHFLNFPINIGNVIIPTDELIFFRGVETTNQTNLIIFFGGYIGVLMGTLANLIWFLGLNMVDFTPKLWLTW